MIELFLKQLISFFINLNHLFLDYHNIWKIFLDIHFGCFGKVRYLDFSTKLLQEAERKQTSVNSV